MSELFSSELPDVDYFKKILNDPVHGTLNISGKMLRYLKQLGSAYFVFPGATHNRFEHSIGVCHVANQMITRFRSNQPRLEINDQDVFNVQLAGLLHDLGHGPFSHVFDGSFIPEARPGLNWTHEKASEDMFDYLLSDNGIDLDSDSVQEVKSMIRGDVRRPERKFLYQIVANKTNGIDVDKLHSHDPRSQAGSPLRPSPSSSRSAGGGGGGRTVLGSSLALRQVLGTVAASNSRAGNSSGRGSHFVVPAPPGLARNLTGSSDGSMCGDDLGECTLMVTAPPSSQESSASEVPTSPTPQEAPVDMVRGQRSQLSPGGPKKRARVD
ncbi:SAM domain and HD [Cladochytrium tenue]|nr:SAM domain and HD [Cladochytrium tenue]